MNDDTFALRPGRPADADELSQLAMRSKGHWGYDRGFLEACRDSLTWRSEEIESEELEVLVAERPATKRILGFGALSTVGADQPEAGEIELEALFVEPSWIGRGVGAALLDGLLESLRARGAERLWILADPYAEAFYRARGATTVELRPSDAIEGRTLPWMRLDVADRVG